MFEPGLRAPGSKLKYVHDGAVNNQIKVNRLPYSKTSALSCLLYDTHASIIQTSVDHGTSYKVKSQFVW